MFDLSAYAFNPHALPIAFIGVLSLCLGILTQFSSRVAAAHRHFLVLCSSIAVWLLATAGGLLARSPELALWWFRLDNVGVMFISVAFYAFSAEFLELRRPLSIRLGYALASVLAAIVLLSDHFVVGVHRYWWGLWPAWGPYSLPFFLVFVAYMAAAFTSYFCALKRGQTPIRRNQIAIVLIAFLVAYTGSVDFLPAFGYEVYPFGYLPIFFLICVITYAILRYRLMDVSLVLNKSLAYGLVLGIVLGPAYLAVLISHRATPFSLPPLMAGTLVFACGLWILLKRPTSVVHRTFAALCASACLWLFAMFMLYSTAVPQDVELWGKVATAGVAFIPAFFYHFCARLLGRPAPFLPIPAAYGLGALFALLLPTPYLLDASYAYPWGFYPKAGVAHPAFLLYFGAVSTLSLRLLSLEGARIASEAPAEAKRIKLLFRAFLLGYCASLDFLPSYGVGIYPLGYAFVCSWVAMVSYAIVKHRLMDAAPEPKHDRLIPYQQLLVLLPIYAIILLLIRAFTGSAHYVLAGVLVATFAIFSGFLANLQHRVERAVEKALFTRRYDAYETLTEFSKAMVTILDVKTLNQEIVQTLAKVMGIETASIYLLDKEKDTYELKATYGATAARPAPEQFRSEHALPRLLTHARHPVIREELVHGLSNPVEDAATLSDAADALGLLGAESCIPLLNKDRLIGFLNLGHKARLEMYSQEDLNLLSTLAHNAAIALDNALLYEDLRRQKAIMQRTDRLRSLETIAGGFAHEIRNPLTSIKTFVQLAPERRDDPEFIEHFSSVVAEDVDRIERLIQEILDYARYMEPKLGVQDLNEVVASCLYFIEVKAATKDIVIQRHLAADLPPVMLDRQQIKQVLLNLFLNALDAMGDRGGRLTVRTHRLTKRSGDEWVQVEVADTGSGIAPENLEHIFDPFYTTKHESGEREGTGLGLTIVHQIVREHRGYIEVESAVGRGTTFYVNLPANPVQAGQARGGEAHEKTGSLDR